MSAFAIKSLSADRWQDNGTKEKAQILRITNVRMKNNKQTHLGAEVLDFTTFGMMLNKTMSI